MLHSIDRLCVAVYCFGDTVATHFGYHLLVLMAALYSVQGFCLSYFLKTFVQSVTSDVIVSISFGPFALV